MMNESEESTKNNNKSIYEQLGISDVYCVWNCYYM